MPYSKPHADAACNFFERILKHTVDDWYGKPFLLVPWQEEAICEVFGQLDEDGSRRISMAYLEVPKKTGKTEWAAGIALCMLILDKNPGCQVYGAAASQKQALNVYRAACKMVEQSPILRKHLRLLRGTGRILKRNDPDSFYAAMAADGDLGDGVNPSCVIADEVHRWRTRKQTDNWDVLTKGGITRRQALTIAITTAGVQNESPLAWRLHEKTRRIREGLVTDGSFYGRCYGADQSDDWEDERTWVKANPSLKENGGFLDISAIRKEYESCKSDPGGAISFRRYFLNMWDQKGERAIDLVKWRAHPGPWVAEPWPWSHEHLARFIDRRCYVGVDLSMTTDMSAVTLVFPEDDGSWSFLPFYWLPKENIRTAELRDGMPYSAWAEQGLMHLSEGTAVDYTQVRERIKWAYQMFDVRKVCFDRFNSKEMSVGLAMEGLPCIEIAQTAPGLNEATKRFLRGVGEGSINHGSNPVFDWNASCLSIESANDLIKPVKPDREKDSTRIDGIAAGITALAFALSEEIIPDPYSNGARLVVV